MITWLMAEMTVRCRKEKGGLFNKLCWINWTSTWHELGIHIDFCLTLHAKINSKRVSAYSGCYNKNNINVGVWGGTASCCVPHGRGARNLSQTLHLLLASPWRLVNGGGGGHKHSDCSKMDWRYKLTGKTINLLQENVGMPLVWAMLF